MSSRGAFSLLQTLPLACRLFDRGRCCKYCARWSWSWARSTSVVMSASERLAERLRFMAGCVKALIHQTFGVCFFQFVANHISPSIFNRVASSYLVPRQAFTTKLPGCRLLKTFASARLRAGCLIGGFFIH